VSYIGGRAKAGKTTVLINLLREALFSNRRVLFIRLEMSHRQLLIKLILCTAFAATKDMTMRGLLRGRGRFERWERTGQTPQKDLYALLREKPLPGSEYEGEKTFIDTVNRARDMVQKYFVEKMLLIYDGRDAEFPEIINTIEAHGSGVLVLLDYIQRIPPADESGRDDYTRVKKISDGVLNAAVKTNTIILSGAQFNRTVARDGLGNEIIETTSFRESGDLEQDGFNLLGIARLAGKRKRYIKMFAGREEMIEDDAYSLDYEGAYSYMTVKEKIKAPEETKHYPRKKKKEETPEAKPEESKTFSTATSAMQKQGELL
jgi:replicative DNA helicase